MQTWNCNEVSVEKLQGRIAIDSIIFYSCLKGDCRHIVEMKLHFANIFEIRKFGPLGTVRL